MPHRRLGLPVRLAFITVALGLLLLPSPASADIRVVIQIRQIASGDCPVQRGQDYNGRIAFGYDWRGCVVTPMTRRNNDYFETRLEGNVLEQFIDAAQFAMAIRSLANDLAGIVVIPGAGAVISGAKAANDVRNAYNEFVQLMDGWGGNSRNTVDRFVVVNPNTAYRWLDITLLADSDDDPFERAVLAPGPGVPGVTVRTIVNEPHQKLYNIRIDLSRIPQQRMRMPVALAVGEGDCSASCLSIAKVINLEILRPAEGDVVAETTVRYFTTKNCEFCNFGRRDMLMRTSVDAKDEKAQVSTVVIRQGPANQYRVWDKGAWQEFDKVDLGLDVDSARLRQGGGQIEIKATCRGVCSSFEQTVVPVTHFPTGNELRREGIGRTYYTFDPRALPFGTTTLVFTAAYQGGATIAEHTVTVRKLPAVRVAPGVRNASDAARGADGGGAPPPPRGGVLPTGTKPMPTPMGVPAAVRIDVSGAWKSNIGLAYAFTQSGTTFTWRVASTGQTASGTITGDVVAATWKDGAATGSAKGRIVARDGAGRPTRIEWDNGVVMTR